MQVRLCVVCVIALSCLSLFIDGGLSAVLYVLLMMFPLCMEAFTCTSLQLTDNTCLLARVHCDLPRETDGELLNLIASLQLLCAIFGDCCCWKSSAILHTKIAQLRSLSLALSLIGVRVWRWTMAKILTASCGTARNCYNGFYYATIKIENLELTVDRYWPLFVECTIWWVIDRSRYDLMLGSSIKPPLSLSVAVNEHTLRRVQQSQYFLLIR